MRWPAVLAVLVSFTSACASIRRPHCPSDAPGEAASERDELLVKLLVRSFYQDDFELYQQLQPSESQYTTLAWRFGAAEADTLMDVIRRPDEAQKVFEAKRGELVAKGIDARSAARCTRVVASREDEARIHTLDVTFGDASDGEHVRLEVFDSGGRAAMLGGFARPSLTTTLQEVFAIAEGFFGIVFELGTDPAKALPALRAFRDEHLLRYQALQEEVRRATIEHPEEVAESYHALVQRIRGLEDKWEAAKERLGALASNPEFTSILDEFATAPAANTPAPDDPGRPE